MSKLSSLNKLISNITEEKSEAKSMQEALKSLIISLGGTSNVKDDTISELLDIVADVAPETICGTSIPNWSEIGYNEVPQSIINDFDYSKDILDYWDNSVTSLNARFEDDKEIVYMPLVDTSNVTDMDGMFYSCTNLTTIPLLDTSNVTNMSAMFYYCSKLTTIPQLNMSKVTNMNNMFFRCSNLSSESLNNILAMCIDATNVTSNKTLKDIGLLQYTAEYCQSLSNWNDFVSAGWTSGY